MSESSPEPTTASDLQAGGAKPGTDYGASGGIGTSAEQQAGSDPGGGAADPTGGPGAGGSDLDEGGGGSDPGGDPNGPAVPDDAEAAAAQDGVQEAFTVAPD